MSSSVPKRVFFSFLRIFFGEGVLKVMCSGFSSFHVLLKNKGFVGRFWFLSESAEKLEVAKPFDFKNTVGRSESRRGEMWPAL